MRNFTLRAFVLCAMTLCMALFCESVKAELPTPTTNYKNLNVIKEEQVDLQMTAGGGGNAVTFDINPLLEKAGVSVEEAQAHIGDMLWFWQYDNSLEAEDYYVADELWPLSKFGYWLFKFADDVERDFVAADWGEMDQYFAWTGGDITLADDGTCEIYFGTYDGAKAGQKLHSQMYAIIGGDAIQFNIDAEILPEWIPTFEECELKGEVTVICDNQVSNGWNGRAVRWDLQACLDSLGCPSAADMDIFYLTADNQMGQENMTYDGLGFWFDMEGNPGPLITTEKMWFFQVKRESGSINVGHAPNVFTGDGTESSKATLYLRYQANIYKLNIEFTVVPDKEQPTDEWVEKGYEEIYLQGLANYNDYSTGFNVQLDFEKALEVTEAGPADVLTLYAKTAEGGWSSTTTTTVPSGFWMTADGKWTQWGAENVYFFENVNNGVIGNWGHMPGADDPGTTYTGEIYLVNENSGYYFTIRYRIDFVSEIVEPVIAGQQEVTVKVSDDGELTALDLTPVLEALGIEETELPSDAQWLVSSFATIYDQTNYTDDGYFFGADGKTCDIQTDEGANAALFLLTYDAQEGGFYAEAQQELPEGATYQTKLVLNYNEKYYVFNITVEPATAEVVDAIQTVKMEHAQQSQLFNLNGQVVNENYRGIVVKNGKKRLKM